MNIKPLFDKVVVESVQTEEKTKADLFSPLLRRKNRRQRVWLLSAPAAMLTVKKLKWL